MGFVNRRSGVQSPQPAPRKRPYLLGFLLFREPGKVGKVGGQQRSCQPQNQDHLFTARTRAIAHNINLVQHALARLGVVVG
jgi:hypothetical protein